MITLNQLTKWWHTVMFEPTSPAPVCLFRILFGALTVLSCLLWISDLETWFGPNGVLAPDVRMAAEIKGFSLLFLLPQTVEVTVALFVTTLLSAVFVMLGLKTRLSCLVLFVLLVSFHHRCPVILNSGDTLMRLFAFILMFSECGRMFSLDAWLKGQSYDDQWRIRCKPWAQRLLQWQVAAAYCQTFLAKIEGQTWLNGTALYYVTRLESFQRFSVPFLFDNLWTTKVLTWGTLVIEFALWTLIWIKEVRYWILLGGVLLHLGIEWTMNIPIFEYLMIAAYINFVDPAHLKTVLDYCRETMTKRGTVTVR